MLNQLLSFSQKIKEPILDLLFPKECLGCGLEKIWLCDSCFNRIKIENKLLAGYNYLDGVWAAASFKDSLVQKAIHLLKYQYVKELVPVLGQLLFQPVNYLPDNNWLLLPVPLHRKKLLARGFNQAELLAQEVSLKTNWPIITDVLYRKKNNQAQVNLSQIVRRENVKDIFLIKDGSLIKNRDIILVDDVVTTGATLEECAKVLKSNGARLVVGIAIAHG